MGPYISSTVYNTATHRAVKKKNRPPPLLTIVPQISSRTVFPSLYYNLIVLDISYVIDSCVHLIGRRSILIPIGYVNLIRPPSASRAFWPQSSSSYTSGRIYFDVEKLDNMDSSSCVYIVL
jgi:hypothetical protein